MIRAYPWMRCESGPARSICNGDESCLTEFYALVGHMGGISGGALRGHAGGSAPPAQIGGGMRRGGTVGGPGQQPGGSFSARHTGGATGGNVRRGGGAGVRVGGPIVAENSSGPLG